MDLLKELETLAIEKRNGHFTLMRFTSNWRCCLGTTDDRADIAEMAEGSTMEEAISNCLSLANLDNNVL